MAMLLLHHANIHTMHPACLKAEAAVVVDGRFAFVGSLEGARLFVGGKPRQTLDAQGGSVIPGLNDSHLHYLHTALRDINVDLGGANAIAQVQACLREGMAHREGHWLIGEGWNQEHFADRRMLTCADLDAVSADVPIFATRACGHIATANTRAMELVGQTRPDGIFQEEELSLLWQQIPERSVDTLIDRALKAQHGLYAQGITSVQSDDLGSVPAGRAGAYLKALSDAGDSGRLKVRYAQQALLEEEAVLRGFLDAGLHQLRGSRFHVSCVKLLLDGSLGARTAWLGRPYADAPGTKGIAIYDDETLAGLVNCATAHGMPVAVHVIGDAAMQQALDAVGAHGRGLRNALVHAQISTAEQVVRCGQVGMVIMAQPIFLEADAPLVKVRVGEDLAQTSYRWRTMLGAGAHVAFGTDCPVEPYDTMRNLYCAITRHGVAQQVPYLPEEAFSLEEALYAYTVAGAYASGEETEKGCIQPGMVADFVVLDRRLEENEPAALLETKVVATYIGGEEVYRR